MPNIRTTDTQTTMVTELPQKQTNPMDNIIEKITYTNLMTNRTLELDLILEKFSQQAHNRKYFFSL